MTPDAPLFTKTYDLTLWLAERTAGFPRIHRAGVAARINEQACRALEGVTLALKGFDRSESLEQADAAFALLRVYLRLACDLGALGRRQLLHAVGRVEECGRMVGGWKKRL